MGAVMPKVAVPKRVVAKPVAVVMPVVAKPVAVVKPKAEAKGKVSRTLSASNVPEPAVIPTYLRVKEGGKGKGKSALPEVPEPIEAMGDLAWENAGLEDDTVAEAVVAEEVPVVEETHAIDQLRAELLGVVVGESLKRQQLEAEVGELKTKVARLEKAAPPPWRVRPAELMNIPINDP